MEQRSTIEWNIEDLKSALGITEHGVKSIFTDGRNMPSILGHRLCKDNQGWSLAPGSGHDLLGPDNGKWKIRSITRNKVDFNPSKHIGIGREFDRDEFLKDLESLDGFILFDIACFPTVTVFKVPVQNVIRWFNNNKLNYNASASRKKFKEELENDIRST